MLIDEFRNIVKIIESDTIIKFVAFGVFVSVGFLALFFSSLTAIIILLNYVCGLVLCWSLIKYQNKATICLQRLTSFYRGHISPSKNFGGFCAVCSKTSCKRHHLGQVVAPWKNLYVHRKLNDAVKSFYGKIIDEFVTSWYHNFTDDISFLSELRYCLRFATASLANKILQVDVGSVVANKLIPCAVKHVDDYLYMEQIAKLKNVHINDVAVEYLGKRLHVATTNRNNELNYLRSLTSCVMDKNLPKEYLKCRNYSILIREIISGWVFLPMMDALADPNIINSLVILATTYKSKATSHSNKPFVEVNFLSDFSNNKIKPSSFATDLKSIKNNTDMLYAFMQFLKKEEYVHLLQFCLDVDDFNNRLLTPDLSKKQLENLHSEAIKLYENYLSLDSVNFIGCSEEIIQNYRQLLQGGVYNVAKLRTSEPLYQAYEYALTFLENNCLPLFFYSNEFYSYLCGCKLSSTYKKTSVSKNRRYYESANPGAVARISSGFVRIKGALKTTQPIDGSLYPSEVQNFENGAVEDIIINECNIFRDLSSWRVSIPSVDTLQLGSKSLFLYNISVQRLDAISEEEKKLWVLQRKDQDFFTLKAKLIEFHGESEICDSALPSRRTTNVETRRARYEDFLRTLLQKSALKGSDLLHTFLTKEQDFTLLVSAAVPIGDLGNIYQSVAYKLRKEKGQHLDSFMNTFLNSVVKSKQGKFELAELGDEVDPSSLTENTIKQLPKTFTNKTFEDNFGISLKSLKESSSSSFNPNGITESLFYLFKQILKVRMSVLKLFAAVCCVAQQAVDSLCRLFIDRKIKTALSQTNLAYLLGLLEGLVFQTHILPTKKELEDRRAKAFLELKNCIPFYITKLFGNEVIPGLLRLLEILQNPLLNKQLAYNLLDIIVVEIYPELGASDTK